MFVLKNINKTFTSSSSKQVVLSSINLSFPIKGLVFIKGESGSGKSTLLNILGLLLKPTSGTMLFNGKDVSRMSNKEKENIRLNQIGYVFQHFNLIDELSVLDNLLLFENNKEKAERLLSSLGIKELENKKVSKLSGGEKQRVGIARALMKDPLVLLCDEPTGALDEENSKNVRDILLELSKSILIIVTSHEKTLFNGARYFVEIEKGNIKDSNLIEDKVKPIRLNKRGYKGNLRPFRRLIRKKNRAKSIICLICFIFMEVVFSCGLGFQKGASKIESLIMDTSFDSLFLSVSKKEKVSSSSSLNLVKQSKPSKNDISFLLDKADAYASLSFALPYSESFYLEEEKQVPANFVPYLPSDLLTFSSFNLENFSLTKNMLVFVNDSFSFFYKDINPGDELVVKRKMMFEYEQGNDEIDIEFRFKIASIIKEFSFLNSPRVYFPYDEVASLLDSFFLPNYSNIQGRDVSVLDFIINSSPSSSYSGQESILHCKSKEDALKMFDLIRQFEKEDAPYSFSSRVYTTKNSYSNLSSLICLCLRLFAIFEFALCFILLLLDCFYCYLRNKKHNAILLCLGINKPRIISLFSINSILVFLSSIVLFAPLSLFAFGIINKFLAPRLGFDFLIINPLLNFNRIPFFIPILFLVFAISIYSLSFLLLYFLLSKIDIAKELKDE